MEEVLSYRSLLSQSPSITWRLRECNKETHAIELGTITISSKVGYVSDFRRDVYEICALLGYYAALRGSSEMSVQNYHSTLRNIPEERRSQEISCFYRTRRFTRVFKVATS
jgi:hypothetical protein